MLTETRALPLYVPRDRDGSLRPQLVPTGVRRLPQFDAVVLSLYGRGTTVAMVNDFRTAWRARSPR